MTDKSIEKREESLRVFNHAAYTYDRIGPGIFSYFGQRLVDSAEIPSGANVLDVAAGRGALLFPAAARVGPTGHVTGIDFAPNMVCETAKDIESGKMRNAEIDQMDAEQMTFAGASFDYVLCGFALWMFADPARVLHEFHRVLKGGGHVVLSTWTADNPFIIWCQEVLRPFVYAPGAKDLPAKIDVRFDTPSQIETALQQVGFEDMRITVEENDFIYASEEEFWLSLWSAGIRRQLEKMTPELLEHAKSEVFRKLQMLKQSDGFHKVSRALFAFATKPAQ
jgi:O-methyltransferase / aklanonic acid methyltransferase